MKRTSHERLMMSLEEHVEKEIQTYREMPPTITLSDPADWFWTQTQTYPLLSCLAFSYLCVQASSTPSERVFSNAGKTICAERARLLPEKADMIVFLKKNCCKRPGGFHTYGVCFTSESFGIGRQLYWGNRHNSLFFPRNGLTVYSVPYILGPIPKN